MLREEQKESPPQGGKGLTNKNETKVRKFINEDVPTPEEFLKVSYKEKETVVLTNNILNSIIKELKPQKLESAFKNYIAQASNILLDSALELNILFTYNKICYKGEWHHLNYSDLIDFVVMGVEKIGVVESKISAEDKTELLMKAFNFANKNFAKKVIEKENKKVEDDSNYKPVFPLNLPKSEWIKKEKGKSSPISEADKYIKETYPDTQYNVVTEKTFFNDKGKNFDSVYTELKFEDIQVSKSDLDVYLRSDKIKQFDPFKEYFEKVRHSEGWDYIEELASFITTEDQEFWNIMFKKHLVRCVKQALTAGEWSNRTVLVMHSVEENLGKTTFIRKMNPFGNEYIREVFDNDTELSLTKTFIFNIEEIENMTNPTFNKLKSMISQSSFNVRRFHTQQYFSKPRRASIWASTNKDNFLGEGANSRWNVHKIVSVDFNYEIVDLNKVWGQATELLKKGFSYELTREEIKKAMKIAERYKFKNNEAEEVSNRLMHSTDIEHFVNASDVKEYFSIVKGNKNLNTQRIGTALSNLGFKKTAKNGVRGYLVQTRDKRNLKELIRDNRPDLENDRIPF